jgi:DNA-directed RNA polymerase subunit beta'
VLNAFDEKHLDLHQWVWVRFSGEVDDDDEAESPLKRETLSDGTRIEQWKYRRDRFDEDGALISRYLLTTVGRVVMNTTIIDAVAAT